MSILTMAVPRADTVDGGSTIEAEILLTNTRNFSGQTEPTSWTCAFSCLTFRSLVLLVALLVASDFSQPAMFGTGQ